MAHAISNSIQDLSSPAKNTASQGTSEWNAMTEDQKKQAFDNLPDEQKQGKSYVEWIKEGYHNQYENWMPWIEDMYLKWFTKDNKASYAAKDNLSKTKVTGVHQIDNAQDSVNNTVAGQVGQGGLLQPIGDMASKEGVNRAERSGKDEQGTYGGAAASSTDPAADNAKSIGSRANAGAQSFGNSVTSGAKSAGSYVGGMMAGGKNGQEGHEKQ